MPVSRAVISAVSPRRPTAGSCLTWLALLALMLVGTAPRSHAEPPPVAAPPQVAVEKAADAAAAVAPNAATAAVVDDEGDDDDDDDAAPPTEPVAALLYAQERELPLPLVTRLRDNLSLAAAYGIQYRFVSAWLEDAAPAGFKAGLTSRAQQERFHANEAITGVLYREGRKQSGAHTSLRQWRVPMLECEIGYVLDRDITAPVADVATLKGLIRRVQPVLELPDLGYTEPPAALQVVDIVASNVGSAYYVVGEVGIDGAAMHDLDLDGVTVILRHGDGDDAPTVARGQGSDVMGGQWETARWLLNRSLERGWSPKAGDLLITGTLGPMTRVEAGRYVADYGMLGKVEITFDAVTATATATDAVAPVAPVAPVTEAVPAQ